MEKIDKFLPTVLFCAYFIKVMVLGASFTDTPVLLITAVLSVVYKMKLEQKQVTELKEEITKMRDELEETKRELDSIRAALGGMKLNSIRQNVNVR